MLNLILPPIATIGDSLQRVDTPALLIDLDPFDTNVQQMAALAKKHRVALRPHAKAHKSTTIAKIQVDAGAVGICCQKLSEAYPFAAAGIKDIFISNEFVGADKVAMAIDLAKQVKLSVCVDDITQVAALGSAATKVNVNITVLIEVEVGQGRCGVSKMEDVLILLGEIAKHSSLKFGGIQAYHGGIQHRRTWQERCDAAKLSADKAASYVQQFDQRGIQCDVVTGSGTGTAEFDAASGVFTEIQPGSYVFMDAHYGALEWGEQFHPQHSLFIASTVMSTARVDRIICDVGLKGVAVDSGLPILSARHVGEKINYISANDEHGIIQTPSSADWLGKKIFLIPGHCDPTVNLYDQYVVFRNDKAEGLWNIEARGLSR